MVVTPGADPKTQSSKQFKETMHGEEEEMNVDSERGLSLGATTRQNDSNVATHIMAWEEPYKESTLVSDVLLISCLMGILRFPRSHLASFLVVKSHTLSFNHSSINSIFNVTIHKNNCNTISLD